MYANKRYNHSYSGGIKLSQIIHNDLMKAFDLINPSSLLVTMSDNSLKATDVGNEFFNELKKLNSCRVTISGSALPYEKIEDIYLSNKDMNVSSILAVGGGTVMDTAKILALAFSNSLNSIGDIIKDPTLFYNKIPLIFAPGTCGTGSEATSFAVVYKNQKKYSVVHDSIIPKHIIHDARLLQGLPLSVKQASYLDALAQGIESVWAKNATAESITYASDAIKYILNGINNANLQNESLRNLQYGSYLAGKAINISKTTLAHAISYPLTAFFGIPHGVAVFIVLQQLILDNFSSETQKSYEILFNLFKVTCLVELKQILTVILSSTVYSANLSDYGIRSDKDLRLISGESIVPGRSDNNPIEFTENKIYELLKQII